MLTNQEQNLSYIVLAFLPKSCMRKIRDELEPEITIFKFERPCFIVKSGEAPLTVTHLQQGGLIPFNTCVSLCLSYALPFYNELFQF